MSPLKLVVAPIDAGQTLKERTYQALRAAITGMNIYHRDAELKLDERRLSEQFGVSRTPLREALSRLEHEGLVEIVPRSGIFIVRRSKIEILEMITLWAALESMAARLVTEVASDEEIAGLRAFVSGFEGGCAQARLDEYSDANISFHTAILGMGRCALLGETASQVFMHVRAIRARTIGEAGRALRSVADHMGIIEALESRDAERASSLVRDHTLRLRSHVEATFDIDEGPTRHKAGGSQ
jgi:DNA-binding GntR family transcriptional regulator